MKKLLSLLLVALLAIGALSLAACFPSNTPETPDEGGNETPASEPSIADAKEYLLGMLEDEATVTPSDYTLPAQVIVGDYTYTVTWTSDREDITITVDGAQAKIDLNEKTPEEIEYTLTATIAYGDLEPDTVTRRCTIPAYLVVSFEDYMNANQGDVLTVEGIVVAMNGKSVGNSRNHLFLADASGKGGYYCYQLDNDPVAAGVKVGMTVSVTATVEPYSGMQELKGGTFQIVSEEITPAPVKDITDDFVAGNSLKNYVGLAVTVKGVSLGKQVLGGTNDYLYFELNGKESYVRSYLTDFPTTLQIVVDEKGVAVSSPDKTAIEALHAENFGNTADVTGVLVLYNSKPYLIPMSTDCFSNIVTVTKTDEEKVDAELDALTLSGAFSADAVVDVLVAGQYYNEVAITWASNNAAIVFADGKLTITVPEEAISVDVTATVTLGEVTKTKTFTVSLSKAPITIPEALALPDDSNVLVAGTVTKINTAWSDQYGNISVTIADAEGNELYIYRMKTNVVVGDVIAVKGVMDTYNNARQIAAGSTAEITDPAPVEVTIPEALALADGRRVIVKGTVKTINTAWSDQYGNITVTIADAEGNELYIYRMKTNVEVGDAIIVSGTVGSYNGSKQIAAGATAVADNGEEETVINTIPGALEAEDGVEVVVTGTVIEADTWSTQYNNMSVTIKDADGNTLYVYRLGTQVVVGDVITVTGVMGTYNSARQVAAGATAVVVDPAPVAVTIPEAIALADGRRVIVKGTVKTIDTAWSDQYGNITVTIEDAEGNTLYIYRMKTKVEVGDAIIVSGTVGSHNGSKQIAAGATAVIEEVEENVVTYTLQANCEGTVYYWNGACASGKGSLTTVAAEAAVLYLEAVENGHLVYIKDAAGAKHYLALSAKNTGFALTDDVTNATVVTYDATTGHISYGSGVDARFLATYGVQDLRTYLASNIPGSSKNQYMVLTVVA